MPRREACDEPRVVGSWSALVSLTPDQLCTMAREREGELRLMAASNDHRAVINMLRHDYTDYEDVVRYQRGLLLFNETLDAIARDFPWLAAQCARDKETHPYRLPPYVLAREWAHDAAQERQRRAREVAKTLTVGDTVLMPWRGGTCQGEVMEVRRTRIVVALSLPNDRRHIINRSADDVIRPQSKKGK